MTEKFLETLYRNLEEKIAEVNLDLCNGTVKSMEHYKQLYGRKEGLEVAYNAIKLLYKKMISNEEETNIGHDDKPTRPSY